MTRLSDSLRSLADRAPVEEVTVSIDGAARRVRRGRRLRTAANATAGVGAAAVLGLAALSPSLTGAASDDSAAAMPDGREMAPAYDVAGDEGMSSLAWGLCGMAADSTAINQGEGSLVVTSSPAEATGGSQVTLDVVTVAPATGEFDTSGPQSLVVWNGVVVGTGSISIAAMDTVTLTAGAESDGSATVDLVNCWDGGALPGGDYSFLTYQDFYAVTVVDPVVTAAPTEPSVGPAPSDEPAATATEPATSDEAAATDEYVVGIAVGEPAPGGGAAADGSLIRLVAEPVAVTIDGDVPEDPFGQYLNPASLYPEDYLYPSVARDLYAAYATNEPWTMTRGTQRVTLMNDSAAAATEANYAGMYFSCPWEGGPDGTFPATSATWDLLGVEAGTPRSIDLQYGWVVRDNPVVELSVTNTSGFSLPGFWGQPNSSFVLVKDGKVVAETYFVPADPSTSYTTGSETGMLAPGAKQSGTFLWRDLTGCWTGNAQQEVTAGTYTLLNVQSLYLDNGSGGMAISYEVPLESMDGAAPGTSPEVKPAIDPAIAPAPGGYDWLELQVWTSLGEITVS